MTTRVHLLLIAALSSVSLADVGSVDYDRDVRPILSANCFACHGRGAHEPAGGLRLDLKESVTRMRPSGRPAIAPGHPENSELIRRVSSDNPAYRMPPAKTNKRLTAREIAVLQRWIAEGAEYKEHWSFTPPIAVTPPRVQNERWVRNDVDRFILARLEAAKMSPSVEADRHTLIRRLSFDLLGLPPTRREVEEFLSDRTETAYEHLVDRMLDSPHFGEKMARIWMDVARYGDTNGYHYDSTRQVWLWRDWVIEAYNRNMPYDQFSTEQLAGDLLPNATLQQKIASGFNRNTRYNEEGGADPDEWRVRYAVERTSTFGQVWLGMTMQCATCHDHKYDPITQKDFYQLYAFFNSFDEPGAQGHNQKYPPFVRVPRPGQMERVNELKKQLADLDKRIADALALVEYEEPAGLADAPRPSHPVDWFWIDDAVPAGARLQGHGDPAWQWVTAENGPVHRGERALVRRGAGLTQHFFTDAASPLVIHEGDSLFAYVWLDPDDPPRTVQLQFNDGSWSHRAYWGEPLAYGKEQGEWPGHHRVGDLPSPGRWARLETPVAEVGLKPGAKVRGWAFTQYDGRAYYDAAGLRTLHPPDDRALRSLKVWMQQAATDAAVPEAIRKILAVDAAKRSDQQQRQVRDHYLRYVFQGTREQFAPLNASRDELQRKLRQAEDDIPFQLVTVELPEPRPAFVLIRGDFQRPGERVERNTPAMFYPMSAELPRNRLGLARWLFDARNPLVARVAVNRLWAQLFGRGIVETVGDFGFQGRYPTHRELLDWLAVRYRRSGWDTKALLKTLVMSATYRQSSRNDRRYEDIDPKNRLLWRAPRFRLPAEEVRDTILHIAGLLRTEIGGPPAFPYQPPDYYKGKKGGWTWNPNPGPDGLRRGLYTFWRRTTPYPAFVIFDAPDRSECTLERPRTNTPLQALVTLNDPQFVEAARAFARRILEEAPNDTEARLRFAFTTALVREPDEQELALLRQTYDRELGYFRLHHENAAQLVRVAGAAAEGENEATVQRAAWTIVAHVLLNLDETITRE